MGAIDFAAVATRCLSNSHSLLREWFPQGRLQGHEFRVGDLAGTAGDSLLVNVNTGKWADFATGQAGGDLISLYAAIHQIEQGEAARKLGNGALSHHAPAQHKPEQEKVEWTPILPVPDNAGIPPDDYYRRGADKEWHKLKLVARWAYHSAEGKVVGYAVRFEWFDPDGTGHKEIVPQCYCESSAGNRQWRWRALPAHRPLYNLPEN